MIQVRSELFFAASPGSNIGSSVIQNVWSITDEIIRVKRGHGVARQGFVFTSMM